MHTLNCYTENAMKLYVPKKAIRYILFQRTGYLDTSFLFRVLGYIGHHIPRLYKITVWIKSVFYTSKIITSFSQDIQKDFQTILPFLPENIENTLDIGSGVGGIDALISEHYDHTINIHLLDKSKVNDTIYYGFESETAYYNSLEIAKELLKLNHVPTENIVLHDTESLHTCFKKGYYDIVTSFISWGFHYPVAMYLEAVYDSLRQGGVLIMDVRDGTTGIEELKKVFKQVTIIYEAPKQIRVCAKK